MYRILSLLKIRCFPLRMPPDHPRLLPTNSPRLPSRSHRHAPCSHRLAAPIPGAPLPMHHIFFSLKRTHHRALAYSRQLSIPYGLTPARFDMLYAIDRHRDSLLWQSHLRRLLGVTAATISRMVRSLEALGDRKSTRLNSSHVSLSRMPSSA